MRRQVIAGTVVMASLAVGVVGGCGSDGDTAASTSSSSAATSSTTLAPDPLQQGRTEWSDDTARWRALVPAPLAMGPTEIAEQLAALLRGGDTSETGMVEVVAVGRGEPLVIVLRETGLGDDSVSGVDHEITLEGSESGWAVVSARRQSSCYRGVDETDATLCI